ncbi:MAG: NAD(P)/FAD-dependent oxidoreductase [Deltaproteobacteria bacterium]|nr:NAD(P)/FAD-dependent oxidoreductase [Deltaproteobacteria bacterium]
MGGHIKEYDAIVIGAGLAGLSCANALLNRGKSVCVLEKEPKVGGCQSFFRRNGFLFESCLHSVAETYDGGPVLAVLKAIGVEPPSFVRLDPAFCYVFPDRTFAVPQEMRDQKDSLKREFPEEAAGIDQLFDRMDRIYDGLGKLPEVTPPVAENVGLVFQDLLDKFLTDGKLKAVISGFWGYLGIPPSKASSLVLSGFNASIGNHGNFFPREGVLGILTPLRNGILSRGGKIFTNAKVSKIIVGDGKAEGVILESGEFVRGNAVISNVDALTTFFGMAGEQHLPAAFSERLRGLEPTLSALSVYLGIRNDVPLPGNLSVANLVYPGYDMERQYEAIRRVEIEEMPYALSIPTFVNPSVAPPGHHIVSLFMAVPYGLPDGASWREKKDEFTDRFIRVAEKAIPGLRSRIVVKESATPDTLVRYTGNRFGAVGGWDYTPASIANRPVNRSPIEGLWLTGHWTVPGVGIHGAIQSGWITASMIP